MNKEQKEFKNKYPSLYEHLVQLHDGLMEDLDTDYKYTDNPCDEDMQIILDSINEIRLLFGDKQITLKEYKEEMQKWKIRLKNS